MCSLDHDSSNFSSLILCVLIFLCLIFVLLCLELKGGGGTSLVTNRQSCHMRQRLVAFCVLQFHSGVAEESVPVRCGTAALGNVSRIEMSNVLEVLTL